jgi:hypothetical protein
MTDKIMIVVAMIILISAGWMIYKTWTLGNTNEDYEIVCIGGHKYYRANFAAKAMLGIKLDDTGKPCKC